MLNLEEKVSPRQGVATKMWTPSLQDGRLYLPAHSTNADGATPSWKPACTKNKITYSSQLFSFLRNRSINKIKCWLLLIKPLVLSFGCHSREVKNRVRWAPEVCWVAFFSLTDVGTNLEKNFSALLNKILLWKQHMTKIKSFPNENLLAKT